MLTGALVTLRAIVADDFDALFAIQSDLATWEQRGASAPAPMDRRAWEERMLARLACSDDAVRFAIDADGAFVGSCSLMHFDRLARHAHVGIALRSDAQGRGYGTDALRVLAEFGFSRHNLHRLHLEVIASNVAAIASYRKVGFAEEGRLRQHAWVDGGYEDALVMGLLRDDWSAAPA